MIRFILNQQLVQTDAPASTVLLDFIRYDENLRGTKIGCREGDCGACTVLIGSLKEGRLEYMSATSCLTPLQNVCGKHVATVEGLNLPGNKLNRAQDALVSCSGTQCGFCTPGFVNSLCGYALNTEKADIAGAIGSIDGNICRCTGYKSIERAAALFAEGLREKNQDQPFVWLSDNGFIPPYFLEVEGRLKEIAQPFVRKAGGLPIGGGTDLYVQKHDGLHGLEMDYLFDQNPSNKISFEGGFCKIQASATGTDLLENPVLNEKIPGWNGFLKLVSSTPIRNIGTIAGNIANASPIGDFSIMLLGLNAQIVLSDTIGNKRSMTLKDFYLDYKKTALNEGETIAEIVFEMPSANTKFNFEKVSKRQYLDIASVNSAMMVKMENGRIKEAHIAMGGVGPIPKFLKETAGFFEGKVLDALNVKAAEQILQSEITPISDARGTAEYKKMLARQLFFAHFISFFPETIKLEDLI